MSGIDNHRRAIYSVTKQDTIISNKMEEGGDEISHRANGNKIPFQTE